MAKESLQTIQNRPIFRETFNSEQNTRNLGGVPSAVTYLNGVGYFVSANNSRIKYSTPLKGTYTVRVRFTDIIPGANQNIFDFRNTDASGTGYVYFSDSTTVTVTSGTKYVDGVASSTYSANTKEIVVSGISISCYEIWFAQRYGATGNSLGANIELMEIYEGTLSASDVALMYRNAQNKNVTKIGSITGGELVTNGGFDSDTTWTKYAGVTISNGKLNSDGSIVSGWLATEPFTGKLGVTYQITYTISNYSSGGLRINFGGQSTVEKTANGSYTDTIRTVTSPTTLYIITGNSNFVGSIDNLSIQEIDSNCLLCLDAFNGVIKDNTLKNTITPTNTNVIRDGNSYAMNFNSVDSKVDCGSDFIGTKSITVCAWIRANSVGETAGRVLDNGSKCVLYTTANSLVFTRDFVSFASPVASSVPYGKYNFVAITSTSTGSSTFYTGNIKTNPVINGGAGQAAGTPAAGTGVIIGNIANQSRTFDGNIKMIRVFEGILSIDDITQVWESTRYLI